MSDVVEQRRAKQLERVLAEEHHMSTLRRASAVFTDGGHVHIRPADASADIVGRFLVWHTPARTEQRPGAPTGSMQDIPPVVYSIRVDAITATEERTR
jgi:hypothetical protein